jgi:Fe-S-cluster-containing hydrogenase component 2
MSANFLGLFRNSEIRENSTKDLKDKELIINSNRCPQNHACPSVKVCPVNALSQKGHNAPTVDMEACIKCGKCVKFCPMRAIALK